MYACASLLRGLEPTLVRACMSDSSVPPHPHHEAHGFLWLGTAGGFRGAERTDMPCVLRFLTDGHCTAGKGSRRTEQDRAAADPVARAAPGDPLAPAQGAVGACGGLDVASHSGFSLRFCVSAGRCASPSPVSGGGCRRVHAGFVLHDRAGSSGTGVASRPAAFRAD